MKVFLVDDNRQAVKMLGYALDQAGYELAVALSGKDALAQIPIEQPDIVVLDVMMPDMDGVQVTRQLRNNPDTADIPIILLTAKSEIEDKIEGFGAGADDYLVKPVLPAELIVRINALLRRSQRYAHTSQPRARIVGFLGVKGGVGTTTLAVNAAIAFAKEEKNTVLIDLDPHAAAVALQMGIAPRTGLSQIIDKEPAEISLRLIENSLEHHSSGVQVLAMPRRWAEHQLELSIEQIALILAQLETVADVIVLDLGSGVSPATIETAKRCHLTMLVLEGDAVAITLAGELVEKLDQAGVFGSGLGLVMVNRARSASTYTRSEIEQELDNELLALITPAPEIAFHANKTGNPILLSQPNTVVADQLSKLYAQIQ